MAIQAGAPGMLRGPHHTAGTSNRIAALRLLPAVTAIEGTDARYFLLAHAAMP